MKKISNKKKITTHESKKLHSIMQFKYYTVNKH